VAVLLCFALVVSLILPSLAEPVKPTNTPLRIAVTQCADATNGNLATLLQESLCRSLADQPGVQLVGLSSTGAHQVLSARIAAVTPPAKGHEASVQVVAEATDPGTGAVTYRTTVVGQGATRPGEFAAASIERALAQAADQVAAQVAGAGSLHGGVVSTGARGLITINLGARNGIVPGSEIEILRNRDVIAKAIVFRVQDVVSSATVSSVKVGKTVEIGDLVRVTSTPLAPVKAPKGHTQILPILAGVAIVAGIVLATTHGGGDKGGGGQLTLVAADASLPADGTSTTTITATARDNHGNPLPDGTIVKFQTDRGLITPAQAPLANGQAEATLLSGTTVGMATVSASCKGLGATVRVQFTQSTTGGSPANLFVTKSADQLPADGTTTATITAIVADEHNNPVRDGTAVTFTTTLGLISPASAPTATGVAGATLRSATQAGQALVTVQAGKLTRHVRVTFVASGASGKRTLFITRSAARIPADGASTATLQATARMATGAPVPDGTFIVFQSTAGTIFPARAATTNGMAQATLRSDPHPRRAQITAELGRLSAETTVVFVKPGSSSIASIFLTRDPVEIPGDGVATSAIAATVRDAGNNPVPDGTPVAFTTTRGVISPALANTTNGLAAAVLRSEPTSTDLAATVTAVAGPQRATTTVKFTGTGTGPTRLSLVADRTNIPADGKSTAELRATLTDPAGAPVSAAKVTFTTTVGKLQAPGSATWASHVSVPTDSQGVAQALLRSTEEPDTATVTASAPSSTTDTASVTVSFTSLVITSVTADPTSVPVGGNKSSTVTATVVDTVGNPAPDGTVVKFSIVNQALIPSATITRSAATAGGRATAIFRSGSEVGTARIRVEIPSADASNDQTIIGITAGPPALMTVAADKFVTSARVISPDTAVTVTALVSDKFNNPVEDGTAVRFDVSPNGGAVITGTSTTTGGFAKATMYPTGFVGDVTVIASTTGAGGKRVDNSAHPLIVHMGGAPITVKIISPNSSSYSTANPLEIYTNADQALTVQLVDASGGPVDPSVQVTFEVTRGAVSPDPAPITSPLAGTATAIFLSAQPTPTGVVDNIVAVGEGLRSAPLYVKISVNPTGP
jgi:adhesin/invasin